MKTRSKIVMSMTILSCILFGILYKFGALRNESTDAEEYLDSSMQTHIKSGSESGQVDVGATRPERGRECRSSSQLYANLQAVSLAAHVIIQELKEDEASRTQLIHESEDENYYSYVFTVARNPQMKDLADQLLAKYSEYHHVSQAAIRQELSNRIEEFLIPDDMERRIMISVPKLSGRKLYGASGFQAEGSSPTEGNSFSLTGHTSSFAVPAPYASWRYHHILDLTKE